MVETQALQGKAFGSLKRYGQASLKYMVNIYLRNLLETKKYEIKVCICIVSFTYSFVNGLLSTISLSLFHLLTLYWQMY